MMELTVIEGAGGHVARAIIQRLAADGSVTVSGVASPSEILRGRPDVLVITPGYDAARRENAQKRVSCGILLAPGGTSLDFADAQSIVTYGMCPRDTITLSSISDGSCVLALQRELLTAAGDILDRQELIVRGDGTTDHLLATAGAMLLLGKMP